ncbi:uncharacterized protein TM35_000451060, partial [Trypanosoma theileri]
LECPPGETSRTHEGTCPSVKQPEEPNSALQPVPPPQQEQQRQQQHQEQAVDNRASVGNGSEPAGSEGPGRTSSTASTVDSERPHQNTTEGEATTPSADTTSSGDGGSNN